MRIRFEAPILSDPKWYPILDVILMLVEDGRHSISPDSAQEVLNSEWLKQRPGDARDLIRLASVSRSYDDSADLSSVTLDGGVRRGGLVDRPNNASRVHPLDAILFLSTPFQVIVESELYDGGFLLWMAKAVGFGRFVDAYRKSKFIFRHAGGKDSIKHSAEILSGGVWPRRDKSYERATQLWACVVLDSDARYRGDDRNANLRSAVEPHVSFVHQLRKRSIESYLPQAALQRFSSDIVHRRKVAALGRMTDEQRMHYNMKRGFRFGSVELPDKASYLASDFVTQEEKALFQAVPDPDWMNLATGFGRSLSQIYVHEQYRPNLNDATFSDPRDREEMIKLIKAIYERI